MRYLNPLARAALTLGVILAGGCVANTGAGPAVRTISPAARPAPARADAEPPGSSAAPQTVTSEEPAVEPAPAEASPKSELPLGGREIFPTYRLVGFCGTPGAPALGRLRGNLSARAKEIDRYAKKYAGDRQVLPIFELIAVVVQGSPGADGKYRSRVSSSVVDAYLAAARAAKALLLLNVQPGHSNFLTEVKHFEKYLREPDVGVALDPEWAMKPKQKPGVYYGQTTGAVINEVADYLSEIVTEGDLPEKVLVFHQVNSYVLKNESVITPSPGIVIIKSVDGLGPKATKVVTYKSLVKSLPKGVHVGMKLFFDEDTEGGRPLMSPREVLALTPEPEYVMYE